VTVTDRELLRRLHHVERERARQVAEHVEPFDGGLAVLSSDLDEFWIANLLEVENPDLGAEQLVHLADELLGGRGMHHRLVVPNEPDNGDRLVDEFREVGWDIERNLFMVHRRDPQRDGVPALEVSREEIASLRLHVARQDPDFTPRAAEQTLVHDARADEVAASRWFAAVEGGESASACVLYEAGGVGQVETVITRKESEGRGLASGVVMAAVEASRQAGHELTFIVADADDWPWKLYERLGFDGIGEHPSFLLKPPQLRGAESP